MSRALLSRRTWLWTSTTALAAACARPEPTKVPAGGPEPTRVLTRREAENLVALAELGAVVRWLHPSDQALESEWEPLLLDAIRSVESASTRVELVEGLRGLLDQVAPTVVVWRSVEQPEGEDDETLDEPACPDPDAHDEQAEEPGQGEAGEQEGDDEQPAKGEPEDRARPTPAKPVRNRRGPPARTTSGAVSDGEQTEDAKPASVEQGDDSKASDASDDDGSDGPDDDGNDEPEHEDGEHDGDDGDDDDDETPDGDEPEDEDTTESGDDDEQDDGDEPEDDEPEDDEQPEPTDREREDRPPLPDELLTEGDELEITQWHRRGFSEGLDHQGGCARRIRRRPQARPDCPTTPPKRRRDVEPPCSRCDSDSYRPLAPGAPAILDLTRGLAAMIPTALWTREGRTLPASAPLEPAPAFDERRARDYTLADRATRLLAVMRSWSLLRYFYAHRDRVADPRAHLIEALCAASEDDSPTALHATLEAMLAELGDGNGEVAIELGKPARRFVPPVWLRWIEERVVVAASTPEHARVGDVVTAIDGVAIDELLARELARTPGATASAAIERTVARLLHRRDKGTVIELEALRTSEAGEQPVALSMRATVPADRLPIIDARPDDPLTELRDGLWYVDATRFHRLDAAARRVRKASALIIDLRGTLADPRDSLLAHFIAEPLTILSERVPAGPNELAELALETAGDRRVEPRGPRLGCRVIVLADSRTHGHAELELAGFDKLGATIVGSASAGDLAAVAHAWLPGGWRLRFSSSELRRSDGSRLWGRGVRPSVPVEPSLTGVRAREDQPLAAALAQLNEQS